MRKGSGALFTTSDYQPGRVRRVRLHEPRIGDHDVLFSWEVTPPSDLYLRSDFRLSFPPDLDIARVPPALWWRIAMICLHTHWALLRPCRVELPIRLGAGERDFWLRLIDAALVNLLEYGGTPCPGRAVDLVEAGPALVPVALECTSERVAAAFSGGKDSLTQSALLAELTDHPLLVTITSPVPWANDHGGAARERAMREIVRRLPVELVEVGSDFRSCWNNGFTAGTRLSVNEMTDVLLYQAATVAAAAANGISRSFLASEADLQYNLPCPGGLLQHRHFVATATTLTSLDALLRQFGLGLGSLTYPLHMPQVEGLLWRRYHEIADLQFSCWLALDGAQACGTCGQCSEVAFVLLAEGLSPTRAGIDPVAMLCARADWRPTQPQTPAPRMLHQTRATRQHVWRCIQGVDVGQVEAILGRDPQTCDDSRVGEALDAYTAIRADLAELELPPAPGYIGGFLDLIDPDLRDPLREIFAEYFEPAPETEFAAMVARSNALTRRIAAPLAPEAPPRARPRPAFRAPRCAAGR
jgi:hypothetical protein